MVRRFLYRGLFLLFAKKTIFTDFFFKYKLYIDFILFRE